MILIDTNILVYSKQAASPFFSSVTERLQNLINEDEDLVICSQVIHEFYAVATKPIVSGGLGMSAHDANNEIENIIGAYNIVNDNRDLNSLRTLLINYNVLGRRIHDTRIVSTMEANGIDRIYTINVDDFNKFSDRITVLS